MAQSSSTEEKSSKCDYDVLIIGGGPAGLSAAMTLGRFLHKVLVCDDGRPRNAKSLHANNLPISDGINPAQWRNKARENLKKYETVTILDETTVTSVEKNDKSDVFNAEIKSKSTVSNYTFRKIILAYGMTDGIPSPKIDGFDELWGKSILHCPFCHGYEVRNKKIGLSAEISMMATHLTPVLYGLSKDLIIFTNGKKDMFDTKSSSKDQDKDKGKDKDNNEEKKKHESDNNHGGHGNNNVDFRKICATKGISIIDDKITSFKYDKNDLTKLLGVVLENGQIIERDAVFYGQNVPIKLKSDIGDKLGCEKTPFGHYKCKERGSTNVDGVFVAGDIMTFSSVLQSAADGQEAAASIVFQLAQENFDK